MAPPCTCANSCLSVANLMWVNFSGHLRAAPNHIIPLVACDGELDFATFSYYENLFIESIGGGEPSIERGNLGVSTCNEIEETCLMLGDCSPYLAPRGKNGWVICEVCQSWYHSVCIGLATTLTSQDSFHFSCCVPPEENEVYEL